MSSIKNAVNILIENYNSVPQLLSIGDWVNREAENDPYFFGGLNLGEDDVLTPEEKDYFKNQLLDELKHWDV